MKKLSVSLLAVSILAVTGIGTLVVHADPNWLSWGNDLANTKSAREVRIDASNVASLAVKWVFDLNDHNECSKPEVNCSISATPTVSNGVLYVPDWAGNLYAIDAATGDLRWSRHIETYTGQAGDLSRNSPAIQGNSLFIGSRTSAKVVAINRHDGSRKWVSPVLHPHPTALITASPVVFAGKVFVGISSLESGFEFAGDPAYSCCSFRGRLVALDVQTGDVIWRADMIPPPPAGSNAEDWFSGSSVWGSAFPIDVTRNAIYVGTGNNYKVPTDLQSCMAAADDDGNAIGACLANFDIPDNYVDSIVSLDLDTGAVNWGTKIQGFDAWTVVCVIEVGLPNCPDPAGPDYDFGQAPMLWTSKIDGGPPRDLVGAGQKSGIFWALDRDSGEVVWSRMAGPGSALGGMEWGSATDGERVYVTITFANGFGDGSWSALDAASGEILWQTTAPGFGNFVIASPAVANGVVYGGSMGAAETAHTMFAMDAKTGQILWSFQAGASVNAGPAIVNGVVYWPSGYTNFDLGSEGHQLYAFEPK